MMLKRSRLASVEEPSQCLQVERANTKSNVIYKKTSYNSTSSQDKTTMTDDFELGKEDTTSVAFFLWTEKQITTSIYDICHFYSISNFYSRIRGRKTAQKVHDKNGSINLFKLYSNYSKNYLQKKGNVGTVFIFKHMFYNKKTFGSIKCDRFNVITYYVKSGTRIAEQASICVYKAYTCI